MAEDFYIGVDGQARRVVSAYVGVDGVAREITGGYVGIDGVAKPFFSGGKIEYVTRSIIENSPWGYYQTFAPLQNYILCLCPTAYSNLTREVVPFDKNYVRNDDVEGPQFPRTQMACSINEEYVIGTKKSSNTTDGVSYLYRYDNNLVRLSGSSINAHMGGGSCTGANGKAYFGLGFKYSSSSIKQNNIQVVSTDLVITTWIYPNDSVPGYSGSESTKNYAIFVSGAYMLAIDSNDVLTSTSISYYYEKYYSYCRAIYEKDIYCYNVRRDQYLVINDSLITNVIPYNASLISLGSSYMGSRKRLCYFSTRQSSNSTNKLVYSGPDLVLNQLDFGFKEDYDEEMVTLSAGYWPNAKVGLFTSGIYVDNDPGTDYYRYYGVTFIKC